MGIAEWRDDLISPERAMRIIGDVIVLVGYRNPDNRTVTAVLECAECKRSIVQICETKFPEDSDGQIGEVRNTSYPLTVEAIVSAVLRHRVIHHEEVLSGDRADDPRA